MENASHNTRCAMELHNVLMVQTRLTKLASLDLVEAITSVTMESVFHPDGFVTLTTIVETAVTNVPKFAIQMPNHAPEPGSNATMDNALTTDGSATEMLIAVMALTRMRSCATRGQPADPTSLSAQMVNAFQPVGFVMVTTTAVTCPTRSTAHLPVAVVTTGLGVPTTGLAFLLTTFATDKLSTALMVRMRKTAPPLLAALTWLR